MVLRLIEVEIVLFGSKRQVYRKRFRLNIENNLLDKINFFELCSENSVYNKQYLFFYYRRLSTHNTQHYLVRRAWRIISFRAIDPKITALNRLRGALRQSVTKLENYIKQGAPEYKVVLERKITNVDTIRKKLFELQKRYYELPPEADLTETDEVIEKMEEMEVCLKYLISKHNIDDKSSKLNIKENKTEKLLSVKLPDIPLPQFSGKYEEFGNFKSQFISLVEDNDGLTNTQKLYYLKSLLTGEAELIQTIDATYKSLLKALVTKTKERLLILKY
ncbi:hypothetical protein AVEN_86510-1 [Araneus ventricosus]|uniref:Uncharacterized protein n=1 Tax=Araneus ventricosus TaxID=182803 RepID=A0A4Y2N0S2_ARAVE|nr:hypothetical protein AVEN_86510-1 [Araneus ventricosus]